MYVALAPDSYHAPANGRGYDGRVSDPLSHFDEHGQARMVGVGEKPETPRMAVASGRIRVQAQTLARIQEGTAAKGDVLGTARLAAISAAKQTASVIPLCHPVRLTGIDVEFRIDEATGSVAARVEVRAVDRTGPEMEAMTAASVALLTIYDMCKAMDRGMELESVRLERKSGGKSGDWVREGP